ncbi:MAG: cysteine desulfurase NifS [Pirellulales bacterium]|nr:cysteine desulfurase NifS [Pirellulales bacterium]
MKIVYADNNATTQTAPEVYEVMVPFLKENYFNPSSMYDSARITADAIAGSRGIIAGHLGAKDPKQILFTSGATESNNTAIQGVARANPNRRHMITTAVEHPAVLEICKDLQRNHYDVTFLSVDQDGNLDLREYVRAIRPDTLLVTIMHANNETGVIFPIEELARIAKETDPDIIFHTDATQSVGKIPIDLEGTYRHVDLLSFSGHKFHAPKGIGALFMRPGTPCRPLLIGGHQEAGRRAGTENVPFIVGLAKAMDLAMENMSDEQVRIRKLRDSLEMALEEKISYMQINGKRASRLPNTSNLSCHYIEGEAMLYQLSAHGICASSGSACTSGSLEPTHVLRAMNVPFTAIHGSIRFSFSRYNSEQDVDHIIDVFPQIVLNLRALSPYWDSKNNSPHSDPDRMVSAKS